MGGGESRQVAQEGRESTGDQSEVPGSQQAIDAPSDSPKPWLPPEQLWPPSRVNRLTGDQVRVLRADSAILSAMCGSGLRWQWRGSWEFRDIRSAWSHATQEQLGSLSWSWCMY